jgi:uncharacterized membrane protein YedE/YeeE
MNVKQLIAIAAGGLLFGFGLAWSGLVRQEVVLDFLQLEDLGLAVMMMAALAVSLPIYQIAPRVRPRPPLDRAFERFPARVARHNVLGGVVFGLGWGVSGVCPGAVIGSLGVGNWPIVAALAGMLVGAYLQGAFLAGHETPPLTA